MAIFLIHVPQKENRPHIEENETFLHISPPRKIVYLNYDFSHLFALNRDLPYCAVVDAERLVAELGWLVAWGGRWTGMVDGLGCLVDWVFGVLGVRWTGVAGELGWPLDGVVGGLGWSVIGLWWLSTVGVGVAG